MGCQDLTLLDSDMAIRTRMGAASGVDFQEKEQRRSRMRTSLMPLCWISRQSEGRFRAA